MTLLEKLGTTSAMGILGLITFVAIAFALSNNRSQVSKRLVITGLGLQFVFAILVLGIPAMGVDGLLQPAFMKANNFIMAILEFTDKGSEFLFGPVANTEKFGFIFAFKALPIIIFFSSLMALGYHLGFMQKIVKGLAYVMQKFMGTSGSESLSAAANIFVGQTEAPLVVKPFISRMTQSELFCVMVGGFATVAGSVMAAFVLMLKDRIPDIAGHLLTASVLSAPAALVMAKIMLPETEESETMGTIPDTVDEDGASSNFIEATARGASDGMKLAINVAAMLVAFIAIIAMVDAGFQYVGELIGFETWGQPMVPELLKANGQVVPLSFSLLVGWCFAPFAWLMGVPWNEAPIAGILLGQKLVLNEFVAYYSLTGFMDSLSDKTVIIMSYALCGFANFSSIGIQIGGIGGIAPNRRADLARFGFRAVIGGTLAAFMTACWASLLS